MQTTSEFIAAAQQVHGDRYDYSKAEYAGKSRQVTITCPVHGDFRPMASRHLAGKVCAACAGKAKLTTEQFVANARAVHGDKYDYSKVDYRNNSTKVEVVCAEHGSFFPKPINHVQNGSGCPVCSGYQRTSMEDFIARAKAAHGDKYDYALTEYRDAATKVTIACPEHGTFQQLPADHWRGRGCVACGIDKCAGSNRRTLQEFIERAMAAHGNKFDYSRVIYINALTPIEIVCPVHGAFTQTPPGHIDSTGCPGCSTVAPVTKDEFVRRAIAIHGDKYDYTKTSYIAMHRKASVICRIHGEFLATPKDHVAKAAGCPQCASAATTSAGEMELSGWVASLGMEIIRNDRVAISGLEIDIYIPEKKLGIEYNGAYWHSDARMQNPRIHELKAGRAASLGIRLITVWDFDWSSRQELVKRLILHALGQGNAIKVDARKCTIRTISAPAASEFYAATHIQGPAWRALKNYALFSGETMVACMSFSQGGSRRGKVGHAEWELSRYSTAGTVRGGASRLFAAFINEHDPETVWSYSDRQHFDGGVYHVLQFADDGHLPADYRVVHQSSGKVWHKSAWQRKHIPARLAELEIDESFIPASDLRTEREMQALARVMRIMDAGKIRWKWQRKTPSLWPGV